jgi:DNA-binding MarR family transcriptional regulator
MTSVAETLEADGLVERLRNPEDRRSYALTRTPAGRAAVRRWEPDVRQLEEHLTAALTPADVTRLRGLLIGLVGDELDERTPSALLDSIGFLLLRAHVRVHREFTAALEPLDIEPRHVGTMRALRAAGPSTQGQLAEMLAVSPATVVQIVDDLERRGLVSRERDPADRRAYRLHLRPEAAVVVERATALSVSVVDGRLGGRSGKDRRDLVRLLRLFLDRPAP